MLYIYNLLLLLLLLLLLCNDALNDCQIRLQPSRRAQDNVSLGMKLVVVLQPKGNT